MKVKNGVTKPAEALLGVLIAFGMAACQGSANPGPSAAIDPSVQSKSETLAPKVMPVAGVLAGAFGADLNEADKRIAFDAQIAALENGERRSWRGSRGAYGYVEPGAESTRMEGLCREYAHTVYLAGRPQTAKGLACKGREGEWRMLG